MNVLDRFLRYITFPTASDEASAVCPSTPGQREFGRALAAELADIGLQEVRQDADGYVYARLPATPGRENRPAVGFIAHLDTCPEFPGAGIHPQIIPGYDGGDVPLGTSGLTLRVADFPRLQLFKGRTLVTTDGTTLLGADDKAGVAEIVTAVETLLAEAVPHDEIRICFTPDEEIGRGAERFDLNAFPAACAYTVDGCREGAIEGENFNAATAVFTCHGKNVHPGSAKGIMVNAALIAAEIVNRLPERETPACTAGYEGFYHVTAIHGGVETATVECLVRDHDRERFAARKEFLHAIAAQACVHHGADAVELRIRDSYANMREVMDRHPEVLARARTAIRAAGLEPVSEPVRGGTDGARLSFMGLPCPNLGTGGDGCHGPFEHITREGMESVVRIIRAIAGGE